MAKTKIRGVYIRESKGTFSAFYKKGISKKDYNFDGLSALRQVLSNEKARILDVIKTQKPGSIYELAKKLKRPFKRVVDDIKVLKRFGFIVLVKEKVDGRIRHKPVIVVDSITIHINI